MTEENPTQIRRDKKSDGTHYSANSSIEMASRSRTNDSSSVESHMDENEFIPCGVEIPASQINKLKEGQDLVIRMKNTEILGVTAIRSRDRLSRDESATVIRIKKISNTESPFTSAEILHPRKISRDAPVPTPTSSTNFVTRIKKLSNGILKAPDSTQLIVPEKHKHVGFSEGLTNPVFRGRG